MNIELARTVVQRLMTRNTPVTIATFLLSAIVILSVRRTVLTEAILDKQVSY